MTLNIIYAFKFWLKSWWRVLIVWDFQDIFNLFMFRNLIYSKSLIIKIANKGLVNFYFNCVFFLQFYWVIIFYYNSHNSSSFSIASLKKSSFIKQTKNPFDANLALYWCEFEINRHISEDFCRLVLNWLSEAILFSGSKTFISESWRSHKNYWFRG